MTKIDAPFGPLLFFADFEPPESDFRADVLAGLSRTPKSLPPKYFYDERGSRLFEQITQQPEYYPTRTEIAILRDRGGEIAASVSPGRAVLEYGSGASLKIRILLDALRRPAAYIAVDISREFLLASAQQMATDYPDLPVAAICADFSQQLELPAPAAELADGVLGFFPGSTIGNLTPEAAKEFLMRAKRTLGPDGALLIGVDLVKDADLLNAAYNDAAGVSAAFNLNLLRRINAELGADIPEQAFEHHAFFNAAESRIEMHLRAREDVAFQIEGRAFSMAAGETIHTENSYKYSIEGFGDLAKSSGFVPNRVWTDEKDLFSIHLLTCS